MLKIISSIDICETKYNSSTLKYMENVKLYIPPEDIYFTKNMLDLKIYNM